MTPIKFHSNFVLKTKQFRVEVQGGGHRFIEFMDPDHFVEFAQSNGPIIVAGMEINLLGDGGKSFHQVRSYLKQVAQSYLKHVATL